MWLESNDLRSLIVCIYGIDSQRVLERWSFVVETDREVAASNGSVYLLVMLLICRTREKDVTTIQKEIQAIIRQITASVTFLPLLDEPCSHFHSFLR